MQVRAFERYIPLKKLTYQNLKTEAALLFLLNAEVDWNIQQMCGDSCRNTKQLPLSKPSIQGLLILTEYVRII